MCGDDCHGSCLSGRSGSGILKDKEDVKQNWDIDRVFQPDNEIEKRQKMLKGWKKAVQYAHGWAKEEEEL